MATFVACAQLWRPKIFTHGLCHTAIVDFVRISKMFISFHLGKVSRAVNIFAAMSILAMIFESKGRKLRLRAVLSMYYCTWCLGRFLSLANHTFTLKCEEISWHCLFKLCRFCSEHVVHQDSATESMFLSRSVCLLNIFIIKSYNLTSHQIHSSHVDLLSKGVHFFLYKTKVLKQKGFVL